MRNILHGFRFEPDGATTLVDALCSFIKEEITFGRIKGGDKFPTMEEISETTGLTFGQARRVTECLAREGYVRSKPHTGTVVLPRPGKRSQTSPSPSWQRGAFLHRRKSRRSTFLERPSRTDRTFCQYNKAASYLWWCVEKEPDDVFS